MEIKKVCVFVIMLLILSVIPATGSLISSIQTIDNAKDINNSNEIITYNGDRIDQQQPAHNMNTFVIGEAFRAQAFVPTRETLTRIQLFMYKHGNINSDISLSIRDNLYSNDLAKITLQANQIPLQQDWVTFDFPDLKITTGNTYYFVLVTTGGNFDNAYVIGMSNNNPYQQGDAWEYGQFTNYAWEKMVDTNGVAYDLSFKIYVEKNKPFLKFLNTPIRPSRFFLNPDQDWLPEGADNTQSIYHMGTVGIGTNSPSPYSKLDIYGSVLIRNPVDNQDYLSITPTAHFTELNFCKDGSTIGSVSIDSSGLLSAEGLHSYFSYTNEWGNIIVQQGKIGIAVNNPNYALEVSDYFGGDIVADFHGRVKGEDAVNDDEFVTKSQIDSTIRAYYTPTSSDDPNGNIGDFAWDNDYFYVKTNDGWKRAAFETWSSVSN
jgi:hypothetical protein